jgi:oligopeptide transport system ATP-binding protein
MLLEVDRLSVTLERGHEGAPVVDAVSFAIDQGETLGIVGESGSGKSMTALALMGLLPARARTSGRVTFAGRSLLDASAAEWCDLRGAQLAILFQDPMTSLHPQLTIGTQMAEVLQRHRGWPRRAALAESARLLEAVRIAEAPRRLGQYPHELSGGQRQRVLLAMALLCRPRLLIADEPTTALDVTVQAQVLDLLSELRREFRLALLLISHDVGVIAAACDRVLVLYAGQAMEQGGAAAVLAQPRHPYTQALLASRPRLSTPPRQQLPAIGGQPPRPGEHPAGCLFEPRCGRRLARCATDRPPLATIDHARVACHLDHAPQPQPRPDSLPCP